ncbi:LmeA family phospholipid-binding protein [Pleurocapsa sp. FMAR1]|uniref:LmeA family phospholipid-binding protein n=1 Tax=Pleurocapsa sp. FMAR1 TaxID=3040204 RepID=UPI0029C70A26|nr:DUF2993 domain-containing protein [Pleurocapsa sp. FMAR1]
MEILTIVLAGLLSLTSSGGTILDSVAAHRIKSQIISSQKQAIRIDNTPNYQIAQGKLSKVRIAARDLKVKPNLEIAVLELETDPLDVDLAKLNFNNIGELRESLKQPLQGAGKLVLTEANLNQALESPEILAKLSKNLNRLIARRAGSTNIAYQLRDLQVALLPANRLRVKFKLNRPVNNFEVDETAKGSLSRPSRELAIALELKIRVFKGKTIRITEPQGTVNGRPMSSRLLNGFAEGISDRLDLDSLQADGILARVLQLEIDEDKLKLVGFLKLETKGSQLSSKEIKAIP